MPALVTDKLRILNASNFAESVDNTENSYYVFVGLSNPTADGYGRDTNWDTNTPSPIDNGDYLSHYQSTMLYGKKITSANFRRVVRKIQWTTGRKYEMYRSDYSVINPSPINGAMRLYDADYYVINSDFRVYICIDNGASGILTTGNASQVEPTFTDLEPTKLSDGYTWKYLYTVSPSDIVKFDSTEFITLPNNWSTSTDSQIVSVRNNGDSDLNENQIKKIYIANQGEGYSLQSGSSANIVGDGTGGEVSLTVDANGKITDAVVTSGGKNYTFGLLDLGTATGNAPTTFAELIPIIPPSKGHGFDIYEELGADRVLFYARFDDSNKDFPIDTRFAQVGIVKNPTVFDSAGINTSVYTASEFSAVHAIKFSSVTGSISPGDKIQQTVTGGTAFGYAMSYDEDTMVMKYYQDRSLYYGGGGGVNQVDFIGISSYFDSNGKELAFNSSGSVTKSAGGFSGTVDNNFSGITTTVTNKVINLGVVFSQGLATPEINNTSGSVLYIDNRATVQRNSKQKEDIKIVLEF